MSLKGCNFLKQVKKRYLIWDKRVCLLQFQKIGRLSFMTRLHYKKNKKVFCRSKDVIFLNRSKKISAFALRHYFSYWCLAIEIKCLNKFLTFEYTPFLTKKKYLVTGSSFNDGQPVRDYSWTNNFPSTKICKKCVMRFQYFIFPIRFS